MRHENPYCQICLKLESPDWAEHYAITSRAERRERVAVAIFAKQTSLRYMGDVVLARWLTQSVDLADRLLAKLDEDPSEETPTAVQTRKIISPYKRLLVGEREIVTEDT